MTRASVSLRAKALGVRATYWIDREAGYHAVALAAPAGQVFVSSGMHECVWRADVASMAALYGPALDDLNGGLEACIDAACHVCAPLVLLSR